MELTHYQKEYIRCAADPIYFLNTYGYVFDAKKQRVMPMTCFEYQERCLKNFHKNTNNIVLKSRQCLPKNTFVDTPSGPTEIQNLKFGDEIYSYNLEKKITERDKITDSWCSGYKQCYILHTEGGLELELGENHPVYIVEKQEWIRACDLKQGMKIITNDLQNDKIKSIELSGVKLCYDLTVDKNNNFFANKILVHNTGLSVITAGYVAWRLIFRRDEKILIIANDGDGAVRFLTTVKQFLDYCPKWLLPGDGERVVNNQKFIKLKNNSYAQAKASSPQAGRGDSLTLLVMDETAFIEHADAIWTAAGMALSATNGKCIMISCVPKDTYVFSSSGLKQVSDFIRAEKEGGYKIKDYQILGREKLRNGNLFFNNGIKKTKINFTTNSIFEATLNHKIWACKGGKYGWFKNEELKKDDYVSIQYGGEVWGCNDDVSSFKPTVSNKIVNKFCPKKINKELAYLIGLYISEGSVYKKIKNNGRFVGGSVTITCGDDVSTAILNNGLNYSSYDNLHYSIGSKNFIEFLEYLGFDLSKRAKNKEIPKRLMEMSRENIVWMLRGIFDGDGYSRKDRGYVGISLNSKKLIEQIRMLLLNFGILTDYGEVLSQITKKVKVRTVSYRLCCNSEFSKVFYEKIGFNFNRKQKNEDVLEKYDLKRGSPNDIIPFSTDLVRDIIAESKLSSCEFKKNKIFINSIVNKKTKYESKHISRKLFLRIFNLCKDNVSIETREFVDKILSENIKWNKINEIKFDEKETFDFSLPEVSGDFWCHSVIYNGILGHQTPQGTGNLYHETWQAAENGDNDFVPMRVHWTENEYCAEGMEMRAKENGEKFYWSPWYEEQCRRYQNDDVKIAQELDLSFEGSKRLAIENDLVSKYEKRLLLEEYKNIINNKTYYDYNAEPGKRFVLHETSFHVFKRYHQGHNYLLAADVARGDGKDFSTVQIVDIDTLEVVAEYQGKISPDLFAVLIHNVAHDYGEAYVVVEANSFGLGTAFDLNRKMGYKRMFFSKNIQEIYVRPYDYKVDVDETIPGFQTTKKTRPLIVNNLRSHMRDGSLIIYSKRLINEFRTFIQNGERPEAEKGKNDDLIFALAIALFVRDTDYKNVVDSKEMYKGMLDAIGYSTNSLNGEAHNTLRSGNEASETNDIPPESGGIFFSNTERTIIEDEDGNDVSWLIG